MCTGFRLCRQLICLCDEIIFSINFPPKLSEFHTCVEVCASRVDQAIVFLRQRHCAPVRDAGVRCVLQQSVVVHCVEVAK